ncbi:LPXTG cell wall anchor domain-containing protein [Micromonospora sp. ZYX-F-536]|uniref:LPXTG cell wall anchor domain-containing protein n=1 Tax=Micromonospora sp. ZYX-F-536 TaxID=3457629 RepID=UPI00404075FC
MPLRRRLARAAVCTAAATAGLAIATPAFASPNVTHPALRQDGEHIVATNNNFNQGFGTCAPGQQTGQDIWVFIWPGNGVDSVDAVRIGWDTDNNGTADTYKTLADGHFTTDNGAKKVWFATPSGWKLETGESTIHGQVPQNLFNLTHTCAGTGSSQSPSPSPSNTGSPTPSTSVSPSGSTSPSTSVSPSGSTSPSTSVSPSESTAPSGSVSPSEGTGSGGDTGGGLPLTGVAVTGFALSGVALIVGGALLLMLRRRRDRITFTS